MFCILGHIKIKILLVQLKSTKHYKKVELEPPIIWKLETCQHITSKKFSTSMGQYLSPRLRQVVLVSGYPVLTAINWSQHGCVIPGCSWGPKLLSIARNCEIKYWFPCGADGWSVFGRCTVTWLPNFQRWIDFLSYGAPPTRLRFAHAWNSVMNYDAVGITFSLTFRRLLRVAFTPLVTSESTGRECDSK